MAKYIYQIFQQYLYRGNILLFSKEKKCCKAYLTLPILSQCLDEFKLAKLEVKKW
jgi:hypothetical protein